MTFQKKDTGRDVFKYPLYRLSSFPFSRISPLVMVLFCGFLAPLLLLRYAATVHSGLMLVDALSCYFGHYKLICK